MGCTQMTWQIISDSNIGFWNWWYAIPKFISERRYDDRSINAGISELLGNYKWDLNRLQTYPYAKQFYDRFKGRVTVLVVPDTLLAKPNKSRQEGIVHIISELPAVKSVFFQPVDTFDFQTEETVTLAENFLRNILSIRTAEGDRKIEEVVILSHELKFPLSFFETIVSTNPNLKSIGFKLSEYRSSNQTAAMVNKFSREHLEEVELSFGRLREDHLDEFLHVHPHLQKVCLDGDIAWGAPGQKQEVDDEKKVSVFERLGLEKTSVSYSDANGLFNEIGELKNLRKLALRLRHMNGFRPTGLAQCKNLEELSLDFNFFGWGMGSPAQAMKKIQRGIVAFDHPFTKVTTLELQVFYPWIIQPPDMLRSTLEKMVLIFPNVERLYIGGWRIDLADLSVLNQFERLKELSFGGNTIPQVPRESIETIFRRAREKIKSNVDVFLFGYNRTPYDFIVHRTY